MITLTDIEFPEVIAALTIAAKVHAATGDVIMEHHYSTIAEDLTARLKETQ